METPEKHDKAVKLISEARTHSLSYTHPCREFSDPILLDNNAPIAWNNTSKDHRKEYIETLPDLQNGPSSLIQGSPVKLQHVGIHNFRLPIGYVQRDNDNPIKLETSVTGTVSLEDQKKGINMSRIMRTFYDFAKDTFSIDLVTQVLDAYTKNLQSLDAAITLKVSYPIEQKSLRSDLHGWQYYDVQLECRTTNHPFKYQRFMHFDFVYSSACPCSYELSEHAEHYRNKATVPHSQRSVARVSIEFDEDHFVYIEDMKDLCVKALSTETQVMVKREDEQAFAELNGSNLKFVEDAVRLMYSELDSDDRIKDFRVIASHNESLHSHNAISVVVPPNSKFDPHPSRTVFEDLGLR